MRFPYTIVRTVALAAILMLSTAGVASAQMKIGWVDDNRLQVEYKEWARAQESYNIERTAWEEEGLAKQAELQELLDEYEKQRLILSPEKRQEREATIRTKQEDLDAFTRRIFGPGGTAERKQEDLIGPLLTKINEAIRLVAEEEAYDVIFTLNSGLGYINPRYEVTDKVLGKLDQLE